MKKIYSRGYRKNILSQTLMPENKSNDFPMYGEMGEELDKFYNSILDGNWKLINTEVISEDTEEEYDDKWDSSREEHYTQGTGKYNTNNELSLIFQSNVYYTESLQRVYGPIAYAVERLLKSTPESVKENPIVEQEISKQYPLYYSPYTIDTNLDFDINIIDVNSIEESNWNIIFNVNLFINIVTGEKE